VRLPLHPAGRRFVESQRVARLATVDARGRPSVVPVCYAFDGRRFYSAVDEKPKQVRWQRLRRLRNIAANPHVAMVVDEYAEDWRLLRYAMVKGRARLVQPAGRFAGEHRRAVRLLRAKYPQYRAMAIDARPMIRILPSRITYWSAS
jgi:PPOX class probable F420-dependent enzyme